MKKNRKTYFPEEVVLNRAEWKSQAEIQPTISQTHTKKFLVWKTLFKIASKVSLVTDLQLGATSSLLLSKIKSVDKSHIICLFIFEINRKILLVIKRRGSATVLVISVMNTFTHCWCGPPMLCVRLHSCHVQSVQYKSPWGCIGGSWNSSGPPTCLRGISLSNISLNVVVTHVRTHSDPNLLSTKQSKSKPSLCKYKSTP